MHKNTILPIIKWTGSKRYVAEEIVSKFPKEIDIYYEPFIGSGSIVAKFLQSDVKYNKIICSDINPDLINLWNLIKNNISYLFNYYSERWAQLNSYKEEHDKKQYFITQRELYNKERKPEQFFFLMRTCYLGLVRYNKKGNSNVAFNIGRPGINPNKLYKILDFWHNLIQQIEFKCCNYKEITPNLNDFVFVDPPYWNVTSSIYNGQINKEDFINYLKLLKCKFALTVDGKNDKDDRTCSMPPELNLKHEYIKMGNSSFRRMKGDKTNLVYESLYLNY